VPVPVRPRLYDLPAQLAHAGAVGIVDHVVEGGGVAAAATVVAAGCGCSLILGRSRWRRRRRRRLRGAACNHAAQRESRDGRRKSVCACADLKMSAGLDKTPPTGIV
jgi:hypothetical protein